MKKKERKNNFLKNKIIKLHNNINYYHMMVYMIILMLKKAAPISLLD